MMKKVELSKEFFEGHVSIKEGNGYLQPWRLPYEKRKLFPSPNDAFFMCAGRGSGVKLRFSTTSRNIKLLAEVGERSRPRDDSLFDLVIDNQIMETALWEKGVAEYTFKNIPVGEKIVEIWFPIIQQVKVKGIQIDYDAELSAVKNKRPKWITYGSSITHSPEAYSPARTWPATVARAKNLNLTSLGFGGNCHIEGMVGRVMGELPADFISMKLGINVQYSSSLNMRTFKGAVVSLIVTVQEKHPDIPIAVISPIFCPGRETTPNRAEMTLRKVRSEVEDAVIRVKSVTGTKNLYYFSGLELLNEKDIDMLPDGLHPNAEGYEFIGRNFITNIYEKIDFNK